MNENAATMQASGVSVRAVCSPTASDSIPAMNGPAARPNRFWNSDNIDAPVDRTPGWITSMTIAAAGPTVQLSYAKMQMQLGMLANNLEVNFAMEAWGLQSSGGTEDYLEGHRAFYEKRDPRFTGR